LSHVIRKIIAREILDSRGNPTVECQLWTDKGSIIASVPSGKSIGRYEALELRDGKKRFHGMGVMKAVDNVNKIIAPKLIGKDCRKQATIDQMMIEMDGTENKSKLGANAILAVSMAICRSGALAQDKPLYLHIAELFENKHLVLPTPFMNIINGGLHAGNKLDIQEYMIVPYGNSFKESLQIGAEVYHELGKIIERKYGRAAVNVGDEGGDAPPLSKVEQPFELIDKAVKELGYSKKVKFAIDCAASTYFRKGKYYIEGKVYNTAKLIEFYKKLIKKYGIISIEDPFAEDDFESFTYFYRKHHRLQIVGDDLLATNPDRIIKAIKKRSCNTLLLKMNQIGTVMESFDAARIAQKARWNVIASHRSGETEDSFIADLAVGLSCEQIKAGAPCRGERLAKYNRLLRIEEELSDR